MPDGEEEHDDLARYREIAKSHPPPDFAGLEITENDPELIRLYEEVQRSQLRLSSLEQLPEEHLFWLAGHLDRPLLIADANWEKLRANAWRARVVVEKKAMDRATNLQLAFQRDENKRNRRNQLVAVALGALIGLIGATVGLHSSTTPAVKVHVDIASTSTTRP